MTAVVLLCLRPFASEHVLPGLFYIWLEEAVKQLLLCGPSLPEGPRPGGPAPLATVAEEAGAIQRAGHVLAARRHSLP